MYSKPVKLRPYQASDDADITSMLAAEGIEPDQMRHRDFETHVLENGNIIGFFTIRREWNLPSLQHFCIKKKYRAYGAKAIRLVKAFQSVVLSRGFSTAIIHADKSKPRLGKLIEHYFKNHKLYAETEDRFWYLVNIT